MSAKSAPDFEVVAEKFLLLCECKAFKGTSIAFDRLAEHQKEDLLAYEKTRWDTYGAIAILNYNGLLGKARVYDAWLVPVLEWCSLEYGSGRKSVPVDTLRGYFSPWNMPWIPGTGFDVSHAVKNLAR